MPSLFNLENFVLPVNAVEVTTAEHRALLEENSIDPTAVFAYRLMTFGANQYIEWWVAWTHPVTGRVYVEEKVKAVSP